MVKFDADTMTVLSRYGFDADTFERLRLRLRRGDSVFDGNKVRGRIEPPSSAEMPRLPSDDSERWETFVQEGRNAIAAGQVGAVILAGGMATRFGGGVKAAVEVMDGRSFLDLKLSDVRRSAEAARARIPVFLLASFATYDEVSRLGRQSGYGYSAVETVPQFVSVRFTPQGDSYRGKDGKPSLYAPGHGDLTFALRASGALNRFRSGGGRLLFVSNVDNLAATLEPAIIGAHIAAQKAVTVELVRKEPGDIGGAPARVDGTLQIVEAFRFPPDFDQDTIPVFNTNSFVLDAAAIDRDFDLSWFAVKKQVDDQEVVQFERLVGQITAFLPTQFLEVPREGAGCRFTPAKDPAELAQRLEAIRKILHSRGIL